MKYETKNNLGQDNHAILTGVLSSPLTFSHEVYGEKFYNATMSISRLSGIVDEVPLLISERLCYNNDITYYDNKTVSIIGQIRTFNKHDEDKTRVLMHIFVRNIEIVDENTNDNKLLLSGFLCKPPNYRTTPSGREITDIILAVNRAYGKSDYIPCICWGRNARFVNEFNIGEKLSVYGRLQSRKYHKQIDIDRMEEKTAYEISVITVQNYGSSSLN